jgi:opacity protein-like surface antigen
MIRATLRLLPLLCLPLASSARAADVPFFASGDLPALKTQNQADLEAAARQNPWTGLTVGSEVFAISGFGHGSHGGFGGGGYLGYNREFDNNVVVGIQASAGYLPGLWNHGPSGYNSGGYNYGMANMSVGYDMGRFMPYVTVGVGVANATNNNWGLSNGLDSVNNLFNRSSQSTTLTTVGAGFNYAVTDHLTVGVQVNTVQARGGNYGGPVLQPGSAGIP